jgi:hypothetical protein
VKMCQMKPSSIYALLHARSVVSGWRAAGHTNPHTNAPLALLALDELAQVAALAVLHDDVDLGRLLVDDAVQVPHDVRVAQLAQDVDLSTTNTTYTHQRDTREGSHAVFSARTSLTMSCFSFSLMAP